MCSPVCAGANTKHPVSIAREALRNEGELSATSIRTFVRREEGMVCPRVAVMEPEKVAHHARMLIAGTYERELEKLSAGVEVADGERKRLFQRLSGKKTWPLRWSWGGFNALRFAPLAWVREHFAAYWQRAELPDAGGAQ